MEAVQTWVSNHKLTSIDSLKPSLRLIHARMHAQALTLAVLSGAAAYHYYEKNTGSSSSKQEAVHR
ncbi:peroxidase 52-like [Hibiscus syriacus]|uniref:Peroxidase 52-like n=1 Tax=Hibiscus syriacus TaxID=106335 RepID=A0A6A2YSC6_HIBSY|nr:peroxidase 52-like [Hibiscus syriacus]